MDNNKKFHRGEILYGTSRLLHKVYWRILTYFTSSYIFAKERSTIWMDFRLCKEFSSLEELVNKWSNFENCWSWWKVRCVNECMQGRARWSPESEWTCGVIWIKKFKREWKDLYYAWLVIGSHSARFEDVVALSYG